MVVAYDQKQSKHPEYFLKPQQSKKINQIVPFFFWWYHMVVAYDRKQSKHS